jgi:hypothetical protein
MAVSVTIKRPTWLPPVSLSSRVSFSFIAVAGAGYLLSLRRRWHRWLGILANSLLAIALLVAFLRDWARHPVLNGLVGVPIVILLLGVPVVLLARGRGSGELEPAS